jgi:hypothetical protein
MSNLFAPLPSCWLARLRTTCEGSLSSSRPRTACSEGACRSSVSSSRWCGTMSAWPLERRDDRQLCLSWSKGWSASLRQRRIPVLFGATLLIARCHSRQFFAHCGCINRQSWRNLEAARLFAPYDSASFCGTALHFYSRQPRCTESRRAAPKLVLTSVLRPQKRLQPPRQWSQRSRRGQNHRQRSQIYPMRPLRQLPTAWICPSHAASPT